MVDERGKMNIDRSIHAHVDCIKGWNSQLSINQVFLATDNSTLFDNADIWFPQYRWFHQKRSLFPYKGQCHHKWLILSMHTLTNTSITHPVTHHITTLPSFTSSRKVYPLSTSLNPPNNKK